MARHRRKTESVWNARYTAIAADLAVKAAEARKRTKVNDTLATSTQYRRGLIKEHFVKMHDLIPQYRRFRDRVFDKEDLVGPCRSCHPLLLRHSDYVCTDRANDFLTMWVESRKRFSKSITFQTLESMRWDLISVVRMPFTHRTNTEALTRVCRWSIQRKGTRSRTSTASAGSSRLTRCVTIGKVKHQSRVNRNGSAHRRAEKAL
jgi:hypothetical protein